MSKTFKIAGIVLLSAALGAVFIFGGFRLFVRSIYAQRTCEWANIDNIELHTRVDVPAIIDHSCAYREDTNVKIARFDINKAKVNLEDYIRRNKFTEFSKEIVGGLDQLLVTETDTGRLSGHALYFTSGSHKAETWQALLDSTNARLWVVIRYHD